MPTSISREAKDIIRGLLEKDSRKRLGGGERGFGEIKSHPFFKVILLLISLLYTFVKLRVLRKVRNFLALRFANRKMET